MAVKLTSHRMDVMAALGTQSKAALEACGMAAERFAKTKFNDYTWTMSTGRLKGSITHQVVSDDEVQIGSNVEYAVYVEMGTGRQAMYGGNQTLGGMRARPYLKPALADNADKYKQIITKYLK